MTERGIPRTNIEYAEICETIRKLMRDFIREYNTTLESSIQWRQEKASRKPSTKKNVK